MNKIRRALAFCAEKDNRWILLIIGVYLTAFVYLFVENFVFSSSVNVLAFRNVDDLAFQVYLRDAHQHIRLFRLNAYAYGWLFWFPIVLITYPFYFLSVHWGIDTPLLILPRMMSLFFTMATGIVLYKIATFYSKNKALIAVILLLFLSFPVTGYFALRFGTVAQTQFFSALCFYLVISRRNYDFRDIIYIALVAAAALATKLSAILILPFVSLILADRLAWQFNKENIGKALVFIVVLVVGFFLLGQPNLGDIIIQIHKNQTNYGYATTYADIFWNGILGYTLPAVIMVITMVGLVMLGFTAKIRRFDFWVIACFLLLNTLYLVATIKIGPRYATIYATVYMYLGLLGVLALDQLPRRWTWMAALALVIATLMSNWTHIYAPDPEAFSWNAYYVKEKNAYTKASYAAQEKVDTILQKTPLWGHEVNILRDYRSPEFISALNKGVNNRAFYDNMSDLLKAEPSKVYDVICLSKDSIAFLPDDKFAEYVRTASPAIAEAYKADKNITESFMQTHQLNNHAYNLIYEDDHFLVFLIITNASS